MPHFSNCCDDADMFCCQVCATTKCSGCQYGERIDLTDITGFKGTGNVCSTCLTSVATKPATDAKHITARYAGTCKGCKRHFSAGTEILWSKRNGSQHVTCPSKVISSETRRAYFGNDTEPMSLYEYCKVESGGLTGKALDQYVNRYYGHN